jgi:hypothetical protein
LYKPCGGKLLYFLFGYKLKLIREASEVPLVRERVGGDIEVDAHRRKFGGLRGKVDTKYSGYFDEEFVVGSQEFLVGDVGQ